MGRALITGITGQDGSYLAEFLLDKGYEVFGLVRRLSAPNYERIEHIMDRIQLVQGDLLDQSSLLYALEYANPDEVYNLAAQSHVGTSFNQPVHTAEITGLGPLRLLDAIMQRGKTCKFYQASTSELFGNERGPQNELTPMHPRSPYGSAKLYAHSTVRNYRESYQMYCCSGILFNHESPRRGLDFVTRKITDGVAKIALGLADSIVLGNLSTYRDWGYAGDYVEAMWLMLQQNNPQDYVIATGQAHQIAHFTSLAFKQVGIENWGDFVDTDPGLYRPSDVNLLVGDASKAARELNWKPKVSFNDLVAMMIQSDLRRHSNAYQSCSHPSVGSHRVRSVVGVQEIRQETVA